MKKLILTLPAALVLGCASMLGVPANPAPGQLSQPDGKILTATLHGDEFHNFLTTTDGYTLLQDANGFWCYAQQDAYGQLMPSSYKAANPGQRSAADKAFLKGINTWLQPTPSEAQKQLKAAAANLAYKGNTKNLYDYKKFKGLVLLVEYDDKSFTQSNINEIFNGIVNQENYTGFTPAGGSKQIYTGSVRDYFHDNSFGLFNPSFDVVGPVKVPFSQYYINQTANAREVIQKACEMLDGQVDFSKYDTDNNGTVDMFYVIFAGMGSNNSGNDSRLVWPHASTMPSVYFDGVKLGRYACSTELYGTFMTSCIDGIGTICHEFSHVLGLMDEYDTDYSGSGGRSVDPGAWSVMAGGSYNNFARTPVGYSMMQRYQSGFAVPKLITGAGDWTLIDIDESNAGYRINTTHPKEYFLLENRRKTGNKWNKYLPGEGMLIYRVDSTSTTPWSRNTINADPTHNYYEMVRACPNGKGLAITDSDGDPFPGSGNVTQIGPFTEPRLAGWNDINEVKIHLSNITEDSKGVITFHSAVATAGDDTEDFEDMTTTSSSDKNVPGKFCKWSFSKARVYTPGAGFCNGTKAAGILKGGTIETSELEGVEKVNMKLYNSASRSYNVRLQYLDASTGNWVILKDQSGLSGNTIEANSTTTLRFDIPEAIRPNLRLQLKAVTGSDSEPLYIDDVQMPGVHAAVGSIMDNNDKLNATISADGTMTVCSTAPVVKVYDFSGRLIATARTIGGMAQFNLSSRGYYIVTDGTGTLKLIF